MANNLPRIQDGIEFRWDGLDSVHRPLPFRGRSSIYHHLITIYVFLTCHLRLSQASILGITLNSNCLNVSYTFWPISITS